MEDRAGYTCAKSLGNLLVFKADIVRFSFKRHSHDYYAIGMIEDGVQRFSCARRRGYETPPQGLSVINPGDAHTGEAALATGFRYKAIYPSVERMCSVASELGRGVPRQPHFENPVVKDDRLFDDLRDLIISIESPAPVLTQESLYIGFLANLISRYADAHFHLLYPGKEYRPISRVKSYIEENYMHEVRIDDLAREAGLSPFYLIRAFRSRIGLPPHAYLESVRVRKAQKLLQKKVELVNVAYEVGFSSQSHFTSTFKAIVGIPPGMYARAIF